MAELGGHQGYVPPLEEILPHSAPLPLFILRLVTFVTVSALYIGGGTGGGGGGGTKGT